MSLDRGMALRPGGEEPTLAGAAGRPASTPPALGATDDAIMSTGRRGGAAHRAGAVGGLEPLDSRREATAGRAVQRRIVAKAPRGRTWERAVVPGDARSYPRARGRTRGRAVVPGDARSYPKARGRTRGRAVVPEGARSYLRGALRYDHAELRTTGSAGGTTAPDYVRPRGFTYDRAGPMAHGDEAQCAGRHPPRARRRARPRQQDDAGPRPAPAPEPPTSAPRPDEKSPEQPAHTPPSQHEEPVSGPQS